MALAKEAGYSFHVGFGMGMGRPGLMANTVHWNIHLIGWTVGLPPSDLHRLGT